MITEIAHIRITGHDEAFEAAVAEAVPLFLAADGCHGVRLVRSAEDPLLYRLLVEWETVEHHTVTFRSSDAYARWRELASPHFAEPPAVEHVRDVLPR
ncbi:antibiotic biosynthesis monooxygenase [Saccharopolyspora sp. TS4A08]|uniref:Antibiotic biosynthesis monooxygenase n=1 Tax=Saccharopolyspora ipomoeae TaxID=3042027 RepID=A0ABT6PI68_9PSEU|nr:antibiotic biosynthesis monooxygenase [Saccharopolyspora sp. TS4A08]MDI2027691.1 antibiotic biosynthesis monooxygenase [Saccharopolyspora sp. TS4A08]